VGGLFGTDRRAEHDELDFLVGQEGIQRIMHAQGRSVGVSVWKRWLRKARAGGKATEWVIEERPVNLVSVGSE
jgi:hypothetical protein